MAIQLTRPKAYPTPLPAAKAPSETPSLSVPIPVPKPPSPLPPPAVAATLPPPVSSSGLQGWSIPQVPAGSTSSAKPVEAPPLRSRHLPPPRTRTVLKTPSPNSAKSSPKWPAKSLPKIADRVPFTGESRLRSCKASCFHGNWWYHHQWRWLCPLPPCPTERLGLFGSLDRAMLALVIPA